MFTVFFLFISFVVRTIVVRCGGDVDTAWIGLATVVGFIIDLAWPLPADNKNLGDSHDAGPAV